jgi:hypothetical protein
MAPRRQRLLSAIVEKHARERKREYVNTSILYMLAIWCSACRWRLQPLCASSPEA